ncbi:transposase [Scytonema sp. HK-05]|uniref:hypothetical protein n=1 Tax=Scytonema sp. HK-05 TaxID=1137095 RepID=UPI000AFD3984|nr:hypothetical protein [Scytonema sp. HK-05]BAY44935.1 transposase [Scytonema sp. HK-05]
MCLHPEEIPPVPNETVRVALAAFPKGNLYMHRRDERSVFFIRMKTLHPCTRNAVSQRKRPIPAEPRIGMVNLMQEHM